MSSNHRQNRFDRSSRVTRSHSNANDRSSNNRSSDRVSRSHSPDLNNIPRSRYYWSPESLRDSYRNARRDERNNRPYSTAPSPQHRNNNPRLPHRHNNQRFSSSSSPQRRNNNTRPPRRPIDDRSNTEPHISPTTVIRRSKTPVRSNPPRSCHNRSVISSPNRIKPQRIVGSTHKSLTCVKNCLKMDKVVYTLVNKKDVQTSIRAFLYPWPNLKPGNAPELTHWIVSRTQRITQEHANMFITLYCAPIKNTLVGINYRLMLDVLVKCCVDYQDCKLLRRVFEAGKRTVWGKKHKYRQFESNVNSTMPVRGCDNIGLIPECELFENRHPFSNVRYQFPDYETAISEMDFFSVQEKYTQNPFPFESHISKSSTPNITVTEENNIGVHLSTDESSIIVQESQLSIVPIITG